MKNLLLWMFLSFLTAVIYFVVKKNREKKAAQNRANAWPEALDLVISSLQSGASITESLSNLANVGPNSLRVDFADFSSNMASGIKFEIALNKLKVKFADPISDQLFEALYFAAKFGSRNTIKVLRELSEYVSADLSVRAEINTRFGWIKNSANLAALAPWLLFLILRTQINAKVAYQQPFGQFLMAIGVLATLIAYYWMNRIANLPKAKRIFTLALGEK
jgi:tight adherence protein B